MYLIFLPVYVIMHANFILLEIGENALHFAIIRRDMESAKLLRHYGASLVARGRGTFFQPTDVNNGSSTPDKTNFKGTACYGEYPLAFAASLGFVKMYDYLIKQSMKKPSFGKVNPDAQDSFGNTVLHWCVIHKQKVRIIINASDWNSMGKHCVADIQYAVQSDIFTFKLFQLFGQLALTKRMACTYAYKGLWILELEFETERTSMDVKYQAIILK